MGSTMERSIMQELVQEILSHKGEDGPIGELANELHDIIEDYNNGEISEADMKDLIHETIEAYKSQENADNEVLIRWAVKIAQLASKAMV